MVGFSVCGILRLMGSPDVLIGQEVGGGSRYTFWPLPLIMSVTWQKEEKRKAGGFYNHNCDAQISLFVILITEFLILKNYSLLNTIFRAGQNITDTF